MQSNLARSLALLVVLSGGAQAQDATEGATAAAVEELEPAVSSAKLTEMDSTQREETDPAVPSTVLAQDVRRRVDGNGVMDEIDLGRAEITGNQELPKVLYIVPWKKSDPGQLTGKPVNTLLDEVLAPIDRSEFIRRVDYYDDLYGENEG